MENMKVLPAGSYMGRISGLASDTGGSMSGRGIRGNIARSVALSGLRSAFKTCGLGSVAGDIACAGAAAGAAINTNVNFSTGSGTWDNILNVATNAVSATANAYCASKQQTTAPSTATGSKDAPTTQLDASYQAQVALLNQQLQSQQLNMAQYQQQMAMLQASQPKGVDTNTLLIAGGVGLAVVAAIFLLK